MSPFESLPLAIILWSIASLWAIVATVQWRRTHHTTTTKVQATTRPKQGGKQLLSRLKTKTVGIERLALDLVREAENLMPSEYIASYYANDDLYLKLVGRYRDETEAILVQLLMLPTNPRLEELLQTNPFKDARQAITELSMKIGDSILDERISAYFEGVSEIGASWIASQLIDKYAKGGTLDMKVKGQQVSKIRLDALHQLCWNILLRIESLANGV